MLLVPIQVAQFILHAVQQAPSWRPVGHVAAKTTWREQVSTPCECGSPARGGEREREREQERVSAFLFPWDYNQELGFGLDKVLSQKNQSTSQTFR